MERRRFLAVVGAGLSAGCLGALPRATGPRNPPAAPAGEPRDTPAVPPVRIATFDFEEADDGRLRVVGEVVNDAGSERVATVEVRVSTKGGDEVRRTDVTVPAGETKPFGMTFETTYEAFTKSGNIDVSVVRD